MFKTSDAVVQKHHKYGVSLADIPSKRQRGVWHTMVAWPTMLHKMAPLIAIAISCWWRYDNRSLC